MEVTEFEPDRVMGAVIHEGDMEMRSSMEVEPEGQGGTKLTFFVDVPSMPEEQLKGMRQPIQGSLARIKELIEEG